MLVTIHEFASSSTWTPPGGMTEAVDQPSRTSSTSGITLGMNYLLLGVAGATGAKTATAAANADRGATVSITLRPAATGPDHIEIDYPAPPFSTCSPTAVTVYACANAACTTFYTAGASVVLSPGGNVVSIPSGSGSASGTVFQVAAGAATLDGVSTPAELGVTSCRNLATGALGCGVSFSSTPVSITVPNLVSGTNVTGTISGCTAQFPAGANTVNFYTTYQDPATGTRQASINATALATTSPGTAISLSFNGASPSSSASFTFTYPDVGKVLLNAAKSTATGSNTVTSGPHHFTLSSINCVSGCTVTANPGATSAAGAAFMKAGNPFSLTVTALNALGAVTPNFGKESTPESVSLTGASITDPDLTFPGSITGAFGTFTTGVASGNAFAWDEVGIITVTTRLASGNYLGSGLAATPTASGNIGRFIPDHFDLTTDADSPIATRSDLTQVVASATGTTAPATVIDVDTVAGFVVGGKVRIPGAGAGGNAFTATIVAVDSVGLTLTLDTAIGTTLSGGEPVISEWGSYMGEPFEARFSLTAVDRNSNTTQNYQGAYAKLNPTAAGNPLGLAAVNGATNLTSRLDTSTPATGAFTLGIANIVAPLAISRGASPDGPYSTLVIGVAPTTAEADGVRMEAYDLSVGGSVNHTSIMDPLVQAATEVRYGRTKISNGHGSELLPLPLPIAAQYWNGTAYITNSVDSETTFPVANLPLSNYQGGLQSGETTLTAPVILNGAGQLQLSAPGSGNGGSVDITNNAPSYLPGNRARATFGIFKSPMIYRRENY
jgi:MSHA biogenesis protein MshQ